MRSLAREIATLVFPCQVLDEQRSMIRFDQMLDQGYGFIVLMNHFSKRDALQVLALLFGTPAVISQPILAPVAYHQFNPLFHFCSKRMALQLCPIVTARTVELLGSSYIQGSGLAAYVSMAMNCLGLGGVLLLAPQGSRRRIDAWSFNQLRPLVPAAYTLN
jgi:hypothetical protein